MVALLRSLHSQGAGRSRAGQSFDRRRTATLDCARLGGCRRSNHTSRGRDRYAVAGQSFDFWLGLIMAHVGGGFLYLATHAVRWRNAQARQKTCADKFFDRSRLDRDSQYCVKVGWVAPRVSPEICENSALIWNSSFVAARCR